jgi:maltose O-acetyltransferase
MKPINKFLYEDQIRMRVFNAAYIYMLHLLNSFLSLMPPFIRSIGFRMMLSRVGKHSFFDYGLYFKFPWLVEIGSNVAINRGAQFFPGYKEKNKITIGDRVYIAPNVCFYASGHDVQNPSQIIGGDIVIGDNVWIGANAIILPGISIGANCVIGAGSVVTRSIPENSVAAGNPARVLKTKETI